VERPESVPAFPLNGESLGLCPAYQTRYFLLAEDLRKMQHLFRIGPWDEPRQNSERSLLGSSGGMKLLGRQLRRRFTEVWCSVARMSAITARVFLPLGCVARSWITPADRAWLSISSDDPDCGDEERVHSARILEWSRQRTW